MKRPRSTSREHESEDRQRRELADARNAGDSLAYSAEKMLNELGDKVPANDQTSINEKISALREAIQGDDINEIKRLTEEVQQASYALSQQMYAQEGAPGQAPGGTPPTDSGPGEEEGDVVEGEFREA